MSKTLNDDGSLRFPFNPGPPTTSPRRLNFYGHFKRGDAAKKHRLKAGVKPTKDSGLWAFAMRIARAMGVKGVKT